MHSIDSKKRLGQGLNALFSKPVKSPDNQNDSVDEISELKLDYIKPNPYQPRKNFTEEEIRELAESIAENGLLQPISVRKNDDHYELISGERRFKAFTLLRKETIPARIINDVNNEKMLTLALIENIQREDLNPMELAHSYQRLIFECSLTQEEVAKKLGTKRSSVANILRLQKLSNVMQQALIDKKISMGHAKVILSFEDEKLQIELFNWIISKSASVRETEKKAKDILKGKNADEPKSSLKIDPVYITEQERLLSHKIDGRSVRIKISEKENGSINIKFNSVAELDSILKIING